MEEILKSLSNASDTSPVEASDLEVSSTDKKIRSFAGLGDGWRYGEGVRIDESTIEKALQISRMARRLGFSETDAFPGTAGEVRVTAYHQQHYLEFTVEADGSVTFVREEGEEEVECEEDISAVDDALERLRNFSIGKWLWISSFDSSIRETLTEKGKGPRVWSSDHLQKVAFPSSTPIVLGEQDPVYVITSEDSTQTRPVSLQRSGFSPPITYLKSMNSS